MTAGLDKNYLIDVCCIGCLSKQVKPMTSEPLILTLYNGLILNIEDDQNFHQVCITFCQDCQDWLRKFADFKRRCIEAKLILQKRVLEEKVKRPEYTFYKSELNDDHTVVTAEPLSVVALETEVDVKIKEEQEREDDEVQEKPISEVHEPPNSNWLTDDDEAWQESSSEEEQEQPLEEVKTRRRRRRGMKKEKPIKDPSHPDYMLCHFCGEAFLNRHKIIAHLRRLHLGYLDDKIRVLCLICDQAVDKLRNHVYSKHTYEEHGQICCQSCTYKGTNKIMLFRHFERLHTGFERPKRCPQCNDTFTNVRDLSNHLNRIHHRLICKLCGTETKQTQMEYHVKVKHEGKRGCAICRYWYDKEEEYNEHMLIHKSKARKADAKVCNECGYTTIHPTSFRDHIRQHRSKDDQTNSYRNCKICDKDCGTYYSLKLHMTSEHKPKTVKCAHCDLSFFSESWMKRHCDNYHPIHLCPICGKNFTYNRLKKHIRLTHNKNNPYKCKICNSTFKNLIKAKGHVYAHSSVSPFHCHLCARGYTVMKNMKSHYTKIHDLEMNMKEIAKVAVRGNVSINFEDVIETEGATLSI